MTADLETGHMLVVTVQVPAREAGELAVTVDGAVIRVVGPEGFRHELALPEGADAARLHAGLFHGILELRAPRTDGSGSASRRARAVSVWDLT
jgi:HSP20 family molecular chaperone IbpA